MSWSETAWSESKQEAAVGRIVAPHEQDDVASWCSVG